MSVETVLEQLNHEYAELVAQADTQSKQLISLIKEKGRRTPDSQEVYILESMLPDGRKISMSYQTYPAAKAGRLGIYVLNQRDDQLGYFAIYHIHLEGHFKSELSDMSIFWLHGQGMSLKTPVEDTGLFKGKLALKTYKTVLNLVFQATE